jgi:hypothetical protein
MNRDVIRIIGEDAIKSTKANADSMKPVLSVCDNECVSCQIFVI